MLLSTKLLFSGTTIISLSCFVLGANPKYYADSLRIPINQCTTTGSKTGLWIESDHEFINIGQYNNGLRTRYWFRIDNTGLFQGALYYIDGLLTDSIAAGLTRKLSDRPSNFIDCMNRYSLIPGINQVMKDSVMDYWLHCECSCDSLLESLPVVIRSSEMNVVYADKIDKYTLVSQLILIEESRSGMYYFPPITNTLSFRYYDTISLTSCSWHFIPVQYDGYWKYRLACISSLNTKGLFDGTQKVFDKEGMLWCVFEFRDGIANGSFQFYRNELPRALFLIDNNRVVSGTRMFRKKRYFAFTDDGSALPRIDGKTTYHLYSYFSAHMKALIKD
jgi:hypothetical protein